MFFFFFAQASTTSSAGNWLSTAVFAGSLSAEFVVVLLVMVLVVLIVLLVMRRRLKYVTCAAQTLTCSSCSCALIIAFAVLMHSTPGKIMCYEFVMAREKMAQRGEILLCTQIRLVTAR